jgi:hypothetical protein
MEYKLPKKSIDLRIRHFKHMSNVDLERLVTPIDRADFVADFLGISRKKAYTFDAKSIIEMSNHIIEEYELINPEKVGVAWHADFSKMDINRDPVQLACMFYFPKGCIYGDVDENDNLLNPIKARYNDIGDYMPLQVFLEASAFFLQKTEQSMRLSMAKRKTMERTVKILSLIGMRGKKHSISLPKNTLEGIGTKQ